MNASGGTPRSVASAPGAAGGTWNDAGVILFASDPDALLYRVDTSGGDPTLVTDPGGRSREPRFLPDGRHFLFHAYVPNATVFLGDIETGDLRELIPDAFGATFAPPGWILFIPGRSQALFAQPFDSKTLALVGEPVSLVDSVWTPGGWASYSVSADARLVYEPQPSRANTKLWRDRQGTLQVSNPIPEDAAGWTYRISPTGRRLAVAGRGLGVVDLERGVFQRLPTPSEAMQSFPTWSPDGSRIAYRTSTMPDRRREIRIVSTNGSSDESLVQWEAGEIDHLDWSPDGGTLLIAATDQSGGGLRLWIVRVDDGSSEIWPAGRGNVSEPRFSPDGNWVAYRSDETGMSEVYVRPFPGPGGALRVSMAGGGNPSWRGDGRELFYIDLAGTLLAVDVDASETLQLSTPQPLFQVGPPSAGTTRYDVTSDGQKFLIRESAAAPLTLVQQWHQLLR